MAYQNRITIPEKQNPEQSKFYESKKASENLINIQQRDLSKFNISFLQRQKENKDQEINRINQISQNNNIKSLRTAGISEKEDEENHLEKHVRLATAFLEKTENQENTTYKINFSGNKLAENKIGAGDILPINIKEIKVTNQKGEVVSNRAIRKIVNNRVGYYDVETNSYVPIFNDYQITVLKTESQAQTKGKLERRILAEQVTNFPIPKQKKKDILTQTKLPDEVVTQNTQQINSQENLIKMGYKPVKKVTPKISMQALKTLKQGGDIGKTVFMEIDGKKYAFRREWHQHSRTEKGLSKGLYKPHHGISVYEA